MRIARILVALFFLPTCFSLQATNAQSTKKLSVTGKLTRAMAIGGEPTGWSIQFDSETTIDNKPLLSIEVEGPSDQFQKLENMRVRAKGKLTHKHGVETGDRIVLRVSSMKEIKLNERKAASETGRANHGERAVVSREFLAGGACPDLAKVASYFWLFPSLSNTYFRISKLKSSMGA